MNARTTQEAQVLLLQRGASCHSERSWLNCWRAAAPRCLQNLGVGGLPVLAFDFEAGLAAPVAEHDATCKRLQMQEDSLQQALSELEPGAALGKTAPADGHCLFHALLRGGLARLQDIPCQLTVEEIRCLALPMASQEQLEVIAAGTGQGSTVQQIPGWGCARASGVTV